MIAGFDQSFVTVNGVRLSVHKAGQGPALLMLHGYPQTHATWGKVAPSLAQNFTCVVPDLRGYGESEVVQSDEEHLAYSKRVMAEDMIALMTVLGHEQFMILSHDRGARVSYRMALDHPDKVTKLGIIEIVPTKDMWDAFNADMAIKAYHWPFLAQPYPMPEDMISANPVNYLDWTLAQWTKSKSLGVFDPDALETYRAQFRDRDHIHAMCEDYRAGATIDRVLDTQDWNAGRKIKCPIFFAWAQHGFPAKTGDPLGAWSKWALNVQGSEIADCGHFAQEENPERVLECFIPFFAEK